MEKKLTVRTQKFSRSLPQNARDFSTTVILEPNESDLLEKRGSIYAVFDVSSDTDMDPLLASKIVNDVLYDSYYASENSSPIQALERSIVEVKERVTNLPGVKSQGSSSTEFNLLAAVLWGNVLYMVQFGKGGSFLIRDNVVKPVNSATEGSFSVASGVVKSDDVVLLGTQSFIDSYSVEELVTGSVSFSMHDLSPSASSLLLKFEMVADFTESERINFGYDTNFEEAAGVSKEDLMEQYEEGSKDKKKPSTFDLAKKLPRKLPKITLTRADRKKKSLPTMIGFVALVLLGGSLFFTFKDKNRSKVDKDNLETADEVVPPNDVEESIPVVDTSRDAELKIERIDPEIFYDIKLVDANANPTDMVVLDSEVVVSDSNSGKLYVSSSTTPKFTEENSFAGIKDLNYFGGDLTFVDNDGYKVFSKSAGDPGLVTESYTGSINGPVAPYLAFLYEAANGKIIKHSLADGELDSSDWTTSEDLNNSVSIAVDGNIYVLKLDQLQKYYSGAKVGFEIDTIEKPLSGAVKLVKNTDLDNIYIADAGNNRVLVVKEDGTLVRQLLAENDKFENMKSISVSPDETTLFILSGSKVYEFAL